MTASQRFLGVAAVLAAVALVGCSDSKPTVPLVKLEGAVTVDKAPLEKGAILFSPADVSQGAAPVSVPIEGGRYSAPAVPKGKVRVTITSPGGLIDSSASSEFRSGAKKTTQIPLK